MLRRLLRRLRGSPPPPPAGAAPAPAPVLDLGALTRLVDEQGRPTVNDFWRLTKDLDALRLSVKSLGYDLARTLEAQLQSIPVDPVKVMGLDSKPSTQADIEARWCRGWCATLRERPRYHRRIWESAYALQALYEAGATLPTAKVLALGPLDGTVISYLARNDVASTVMGPDVPWFRDDLTDPVTFARNVAYIPEGQAVLGAFTGFDACWSIGQAGRLGSIRKGMDFIVQAMDTLKPGGLAVHVFDFNFADDGKTIDNWPSVLFQQTHIEALAEELRAAGHAPRPLSFDVGHQSLDRFIDVPPFDLSRSEAFASLWKDGWQSAHLKVSLDGFPATAFGLVCKRKDKA